MAAVKKYVVFIFGWDLFPLSSLKELIAKPIGLPSEFLHVGIGVYNRLYHFTQEGIQISVNMPVKYQLLKDPNQEMNFGLTEKSKPEFEKWIDEQTRGDFGPESYHVNLKNCICFARAACKFLDVSFQGPQVALQTWLETSLFPEPLLESMRRTTLARYTAALSSKKSGKSRSLVNVGLAIVEVFTEDVGKILEKQYTYSDSGAQYEKEDASVSVGN